MQIADDKGTGAVQHPASEGEESDLLVRTVQAYINKHPESAVVFGITTSKGKQVLKRGGKAGVRGPMATQLELEALVETVAERKKNGPQVIPATSVDAGTAKQFMDAVRRKMGELGG